MTRTTETPAPTPSSQSPATVSVLVVDDERGVREMLVEFLEDLGYACISAGNGEAALEALDQKLTDIVLSDIEMPGIDGVEFLERIKARHPDLDVIMVTGIVDAQVAVNAIRKGAADYVTKPFNLEEVEIVVQRVLEKRRLIEENRAYQQGLETQVEERTRKIRELLTTLEDSYESTLGALVTALDLRDNETQGHSLRVVEYAVLVGEAMGLEPEELTWVRRGAILHDVGKIGIPDAILRKPGKLTDEEWLTMRQHPEMGYRMLKHIKFLEPALDIVLSHQERFDGKGYPNGKRGEEIPLGARIFAVVDTFDAMTSDRPYRKALSIEAACDEIRRCTGTQFDPRVAEAFLAIPADKWRAIRERVHREVEDTAEQLRRSFLSGQAGESV